MRKYGMYFAWAGATVCLIVCGIKFGGSSFSHGGVGVVDLDRVAAETGKSLEMRDALQRGQNQLRQELVGLESQANAQLRARHKEIVEDQGGDEASPESKQKFQQIRQQAANILVQAKNTADTKLNQFYQVQVARFRAELKPIIHDAAAKHGLSVVIPKNEGLLLAVEPGADITDEVIKAYQSKKPAAAAPAPAAPSPAAAAPAPAPATAAKAQAPRAASSESKESGESSTTR